ncbi:hypothetical protein AWM75_00630 [Aerococcus urinaehominis]|uniref:Uncharacterized protein n=1 Tax=Aerococcus urinaehominis TaxID=128944 RepID=A0A109RGD0_9LACT|nr:CapA family protein [Aerococcus urinaehominis]AMB98586.1 hypothetical protein AWM75_00630 [Aerococcus urinaehominis]SDL76818.1 poly-gamma-glutamate synthesis protein (capsule biosynthesis protein) [Aerococcus urinaehominis]
MKKFLQGLAGIGLAMLVVSLLVVGLGWSLNLRPDPTDLSNNSRETRSVSSTNEEGQAKTSQAAPADERRLSFYGVGDNLIHQEIFTEAQQADGSYDFDYLYTEVKDQIQAADIAYINQETIIGGDELGISGYPDFNTPEDMRQSVVKAGFDLVNGANNHTMDRGGTGAENTLDLWDEYADQVIYLGIYRSQDDRDRIRVIDKNGIKLAVMTYTYGTNGIPLDMPWRTNLIDEDPMRHDVAQAKQEADAVMVLMHWGDEYAMTLNQDQVYYSQLLADLGVDVVVGTHTHNLQGVDWLDRPDGKQMLVTYSLGNFVCAPYYPINGLGGAIKFDIVKTDGQVHLEKVELQPVVTHFDRTKGQHGNFKIYNLQDYPADKIALNGHQLDYAFYYDYVRQMVKPEFLNEEVLAGMKAYLDE